MDTVTLPQQLHAADPDLACFFLDRLEALVFRLETTGDHKERGALGIAAFSVFLDCLDLGLQSEATMIVDRVRAVAA